MIKRGIRRGLLIGLAILIALPLAAVPLAWLLARASLPETAGRVTVAGLEQPADILRDPDGVVTIRAQSRADAVFALGYAHAQDRLWQMDLTRRSGAGRLSEVVGSGTLEIDRLLRGLGLYRVAEANLAALSPETRALIEAYSAGVNAFLEEPDGPWPPEFLILRYEPEPWAPADSLVWGRLMALQLSGNWREELLRADLAQRFSEDEIALLFPPYPGDGPVSISGLPGLFGTEPEGGGSRLAEILPWELMPKKASNSWALAGSRTESGAPILANDPHLGLAAPGTWYLVRIETPEGVVAGATAPGVPFVVLGHNGHIAWGFTTTESDTQDLFIERLTEGRPDHYDTPDGPRPFAQREETIAVRGAEPETLSLRATRHGPVISDFLPEAAAPLAENQVMALAWPALADDDRTGDALAGLWRATDWPSFLAAMRHFHSPQQNVIYADTAGSIGLVVPARVPLRRNGNGILPVPGWSGEHDWIGMIPFEELPQTLDPAGGQIVAANNRIPPPGYPHLLTARWREPFRAQRVLERLAPLGPATLEDNRAIQLDIVSMAAERLLPRLLAVEMAEPRLRAARDRLSAWDRRMDRERPEPLIFAAWLDALNRALLAERLGERFDDFARPNPLRIEQVLADGAWCDSAGSEAVESCDQRIEAALDEALAAIEAAYGAEPADWRWGEAHVAPLAHPVFGRIPVLRDLLGRPLATDGGAVTVNRGAAAFDGPFERRFRHVHGPGLRALYDLSDLDRSQFMIATGQSGHPLAGSYLGFAERWADGAYVTLTAPNPETAEVLTLTPR